MNRRKLLQYSTAAGILGVLYYFGFASRARTEVVKHTQMMMGTIVNITVCSEDIDSARQAISATVSRMQSLSDMMSTYVEDSPLSQLNRDGILEKAPPELIEVFTLSHQLSELTNGAFDPTIFPLLGRYKQVKDTGVLPPSQELEKLLELVNYKHIEIGENNTIQFTHPGTQATLDGIAKGFIVDSGIDVLKSHGLANAFVEAGGDLMATGTRPDGEPWKIGIRNPRNDDLEKMDKIGLSDMAIATSGDYLQYFTEDKKIHHIINPFTGYSPVETASSSFCTAMTGGHGPQFFLLPTLQNPNGCFS